MSLEFGKPIPIKNYRKKATGGRAENQRINEWLETHPGQVLPIKFPEGEDRRKFRLRILNAVRYRHPNVSSSTDETYLYIHLT